MKLMNLGWGPWLLGLWRGFISGGSTAVVSSPALMGIDPGHFNLQNGRGHMLEAASSIFLVNAIYRTAEFLKDHPAPEIIPEAPPK